MAAAISFSIYNIQKQTEGCETESEGNHLPMLVTMDTTKKMDQLTILPSHTTDNSQLPLIVKCIAL